MAGKQASGLQKPMKPSAELSAVIGGGDVSRSEAVKRLWDYIKANKLQDQKNKREINADAKLKPVFGGKDKVTMFEMNSHLSKHLK